MRKLRKEIDNLSVVAEEIRKEKIVCSPTDTLYGLLGSALSEKVYRNIYRLKRRSHKKPLIVLFDSIERAESLGVLFPKETKEKLRSIFPERLTVVLPLNRNSPLGRVLKRENVAVRVPKDEFLLKLISETFPLFAPSANPEGERPSESCSDCERYFDNRISLCLEGKMLNLPSTLVSLLKGKPELLREGAFPFERVKEVFGE